MLNVVVIGANRGIGLGFVEQYLESGDRVVATYRNEGTLGELRTLKDRYPEALSLVRLEVTDSQAVEQFARTVEKVDLLILNAGIKGYPISNTRPPGNMLSELEAALAVNTIAPDHLIRSFYSILSKQENACVVYMSSRVGQTADNGSGGYHPYRISKAAANALIWNWSLELMLEWKKTHQTMDRTPCAVAICAGWVKTDMGGPNARLSVRESVSGMRRVIEHVRQTKKSNGLYMYDGAVAESR